MSKIYPRSALILFSKIGKGKT